MAARRRTHGCARRVLVRERRPPRLAPRARAVVALGDRWDRRVPRPHARMEHGHARGGAGLRGTMTQAVSASTAERRLALPLAIDERRAVGLASLIGLVGTGLLVAA